MDNNTRRYPRTMREAFGPYTDNRLREPSERSVHPADIAIAAIGAAFLTALLLGMIP